MSNQIPPVKLPPSPAPSWLQEDRKDQWLALNVSNSGQRYVAEPNSSASPSSVPDASLSLLIDALREQTAAITKLVRSNEALIEAMSQVDQEADPDAPASTYLSGKRI